MSTRKRKHNSKAGRKPKARNYHALNALTRKAGAHRNRAREASRKACRVRIRADDFSSGRACTTCTTRLQ